MSIAVLGLQAKLWKCSNCCCVFQNGWKRHMHGKICNATTNNTFNPEHDEHRETEPYVHSHENNAVVEPKRSDAEGYGEKHNSLCNESHRDCLTQEEHSDAIDNVTYEEGGPLFEAALPELPYTQKQARDATIAPKDMEILLLLQCTDETVVGTSREQKQSVLDYVKSFDTQRTNLLPKSIKTCYDRMDKVSCCYCIPNGVCSETACTTCFIVINVHNVHYIDVSINVHVLLQLLLKLIVVILRH